MSWANVLDKDVILAIVKLLGIGLSLLAGAYGMTAASEATAAKELAKQEAAVAVDKAEEEKFGAYGSFSEYIMDVERRRAACDVALDAARRDRADDEDFAAAYEACHSPRGVK